MAFRFSDATPTFILSAAFTSVTFPALAQEASSDLTEPAAASQTSPAAQAPPASQAEEKSEGEDGPGFGVYVEGNGAAVFAFASSHEWQDDCPAANIGTESWAPACSASAPIGVLADGRFGLRFGHLGVELMGVFAGDWSRASFDEAIPGLSADSSMDIGRVGGGIGAGLRLMTSPGFFRLSGGAGGGIMFRHVYSTISSLDGSSVGYQAPFLIGDVTMTLLGFLNVGVVAMVEFSKDVTLEPDFSSIAGPAAGPIEEAIGPVTVFQGTQFFLGPRVGLHFGG